MNNEIFKKELELFNGTFEDGEVMFTSKDIAKLTGKRHDNVMQDIRIEIEQLFLAGITTDEVKSQLNFQVAKEDDKQGKPRELYSLNSQGVRQIMMRYSAFIRFEVNKKLLVLENIAKFGGREISYDDLNSKHSVLKPLLYHFSEVVNTAKEIAKQPIPEDMEYLEDLSKRLKKIVHDEDKFEEWWNSLIQHQNDTGITDRIINIPNKEEM